ncbi:hypothetical protein INT45_006668 [Circinella minor]|uniref:Uncharacterized protein n=1 Tax=Circinella minor TaxID=1195481 RepID=A0A8H7VA71_9FUNG|nr:hypothetical protein INT45_006668 [Circinella minor]
MNNNNNPEQQTIVNMNMVFQLFLQLSNNLQENTNAVTQMDQRLQENTKVVTQIDQRLARVEELVRAAAQQQQQQQEDAEDFRPASPSPPPLPIVIDQAVIVPTPFDQSQRTSSGEYAPPRVQITTEEELRLTKRAALYQAPPIFPILNNVIPKPATQERPDIIRHFINKPCNIGPTLEHDVGMYNMLRDEAARHRHALLRARDQIPSHLKKSWNNYDGGVKSTEIALFEYKAYRMFKLPMHLCEDHWVANFLLRKAALVRESKESMDTTSVMSGISGQAVSLSGPSLSLRLVASEMSTDSVAQETSGERFSVISSTPSSSATPSQPQQQPQPQLQPPTPRLRPHHASPQQQPSSSSHQPLEGMLDPRMPSLHTAFFNNKDNNNSTSRFWQNTFADRGVFIPTTHRNSALSSSTSSTTKQCTGRKKKWKVTSTRK